MTGSSPGRDLALAARLILICHASTAATRGSCFPADEPLDQHGKTGAAAITGRVPSADRWLTSPELRTRQTASGAWISRGVEPTLRDCNYGSWSGRSFEDVYAHEPEGVATGCATRPQRRTAANRSIA